MNGIQTYPKKNISDLCTIEMGKGVICNIIPGEYTFISGNLRQCSTNTYSYDSECILLVGMGNDIGKILHWKNGNFTPNYNLYVIKIRNKELLDYRYLYLYLTANNDYIKNLVKQDVGYKTIDKERLMFSSISLPNIEIQQKIIKEHESLLKQSESINFKIFKLIESLIDKN